MGESLEGLLQVKAEERDGEQDAEATAMAEFEVSSFQIDDGEICDYVMLCHVSLRI